MKIRSVEGGEISVAYIRGEDLRFLCDAGDGLAFSATLKDGGTDAERIEIALIEESPQGSLLSTLLDPSKLKAELERRVNDVIDHALIPLYSCLHRVLPDAWIDMEFKGKPQRKVFVPLVIYPINGRAEVPSLGHWVENREQAIASIFAELSEQEIPDLADIARQLLEKHDRVRCGRIYCEIRELELELENRGVAVVGEAVGEASGEVEPVAGYPGGSDGEKN